MNNHDFTASILVDQSPREVFKAINNPRAWWSEEIEGITDTVNAEWSYHYEDVHLCSMKVIEMIPDKKVVWLVTQNFFKFTVNQNEWTNTRIIFEISETSNKTQINFTHLGLLPGQECYEVCANAWTGYITKSLLNLITTGKGNPNIKCEITSHQKIN